MGYMFTNIHLRKSDAWNAATADAIAAQIAQKFNLRQVDTADKADITTVILCPKDSEWITVASDCLNADLQAQLEMATSLSKQMNADALAIGCFDSDYLFLNLLNTNKGLDLWAATGSAAGIGVSGMRRSNFRAWSGYVSDVDAFRTVMKKKRVFAEECLCELEQILKISQSQSTSNVEDAADASDVYRYYYSMATQNSHPPVLSLWLPPAFAPKDGHETMLSVVNYEGASRGLQIYFTGEEIEKDAILFDQAFIQVHDKNGEWEYHPLDLRESQLGDGRKCFAADLPQLPIYSVSKSLPWQKREELEFQRMISLRFVAESILSQYIDRELPGLTVYFVPKSNVQGQCAWRGRKESDFQ